ATGSTAATHRAAGRPAGPPAAVGTDLFSPPTGPAESGNGDGPLTSLPPAGQASSRGRAATTDASVTDSPTASPADSTDGSSTGSSTGSTTGSTIGEVSAPSTAESTPEGPPHGTAPGQSTSSDSTSSDTASNDSSSNDSPSSDSPSGHTGAGHGKSATREAAAPAATGLTFQAPTTTLLPQRSAKTGGNGGTDDSTK